MRRHPEVEQVGFVRFSDDPGDPVRAGLRMAGGEFCGNASCCAAVLWFLDHGTAELQGRLADIKTRYRSDEYIAETETGAGADALRAAFPAMRRKGQNQLAFYEKDCAAFDVLRLVADQRIALLKMERQEPTLESLFMEVVEK